MPLSLAAAGRRLAALLGADLPPAVPADRPEVDDLDAWPVPEEAFPVHVAADHAAVRLQDGRLSIAIDGGEPTTVRLDDVACLMAHGNTTISSPALIALMRRGRPVLWHGFDGRLVGQTLGLAGQPSAVREAQYAAAADPTRTLAIARALVAAKIAGSRRLLARRFGARDEAVRRLARLEVELPAARSLDRLRGFEGAAAEAYFAAWPRMISPARPHLAFTGRSRRPPGDAANAALSYLYAVLHGRCAAAAVAAGLDPMVGFLHARRAGRAALALDLMEPLRPLIVDAALIAAFNNGEFPPEYFETPAPGGPGHRLSARGRHVALQIFERRLAQRATDGGSGRRGAYLDALTGQAFGLARALRRGEAFTAFGPKR
ncbi:MAG TPA: CRISPR-associated endonuclease Cas1 [Caulobacteraceae bacterium]|nr:CRISPR-associated endonuclease Cas1 [Caulobacteraceae bacterium]